MNLWLYLLNLLIVTIAKSVMSFSYIIIISFVYYLIVKSQKINLYGFIEPYQNSCQLIESIIQGIGAGIIGSIIITFVGLPICLTNTIFFLLPIAFILAFIHPRFICFSYSGAIVSMISLVFRGQKIFGVIVPIINIDICGLMVLVGILHLMEALLTYFFGSKYAIPTITKRDNKIMIGFIMQRFWPVPLALLTICLGTVKGDLLSMKDWWPLMNPVNQYNIAYFFALIPIIGVLGYRTITISYEPVKKSKKSAINLLIYSIGMLIFAVLSSKYLFVKWIGTIYMALIHEALIQYDYYSEMRQEPIYMLPKEGVRVMSVKIEEIGHDLGIQVGDIIHTINNTIIYNDKEYKELINQKPQYVFMEIIKINGEKRNIEWYNNRELGIKILPNNPNIIFKYTTLNKFSLSSKIIKLLNKKI